MSALKIGYDAKRAFFNNRGLGNYSRDTIRIMSTQRENNRYFLFSPHCESPIDFERNSNCVTVEPEGFIGRRFPALWRSSGCLSDIRRLELDIYHGLSNELPIGSGRTNTRYIVTMHDVIFLKHPEWFPLADRYLFRMKYVNSCRRADQVIAISEATKRDIVEFIGVDEQKIRVVYQSCNPLFHKEPSRDEVEALRGKHKLPSAYLLTVCAIEERKNHQCVMRALSLMKDPLPYVIVGRESAYKRELEKLAAELHIEHLIIWLHDVPTADLPALYHGASIFVYPSLYEGFGIPIIEAECCNLPVITSQGSCFSEAGGQGACYLDPKRPEDWAFAIKEILEEESVNARMRHLGILNVARFNDETIAHQLMDVYLE